MMNTIPTTSLPGAPRPLSQGEQHVLEILQSKDETSLPDAARNLRGSLITQLQRSPYGIVPDDPVLKLVGIVADGAATPRDELWNRAIHALTQKCDAYRLVLGEAIPSELLSQAAATQRRDAFNLGRNATLAGDLDEFLHQLDASAGDPGFFPTGIEPVDSALGGGLHGLTFVLGDRGVGKTQFLLQCMLQALESDPQTAVLFLSLDMPKARIIERIFVNQLEDVDGHIISRQVPDDLRQRIDAEADADYWHRMKVVTTNLKPRADDEPGEPRSRALNAATDDVKTAVGNLVRRTGANRVLVVIDLFQRMSVPNSISATDRDEFRLDVIAGVGRALQLMLGPSNFAFLVTSEMRKRENQQRPRRLLTDDMKGVGRMASDADTILLLETERRVNDDVNVLRLEIAKGRDGVVRGEHQFLFHHRIAKFDPVDAGGGPTPDAKVSVELTHDPLED